jgi:hypothetical protein
VSHRADQVLAMLLLATSTANELSWQGLPPALQGMWTYITAAPLTLLLLVLVGAAWQRSPAMVAVCAAVAVQALPTPICAAAWLVWQWALPAGADTCSATAGHLALWLSAACALFVLWRWPRHA